MTDRTAGSAETTAISPDEYGKTLRGLELVKISLVNCQVNVDLDVAADAFADAAKSSKPVRVDITDNCSFEIRENTVIVRQTYALNSRHGRKTLIGAKAEYVVAFQASEGFTDEFFEIFQHVALPMYTWPYFRELVSSMTDRAGLPKLELGLRHIPQF